VNGILLSRRFRLLVAYAAQTQQAVEPRRERRGDRLRSVCHAVPGGQKCVVVTMEVVTDVLSFCHAGRRVRGEAVDGECDTSYEY
jgi:hypothetical protein